MLVFSTSKTWITEADVMLLACFIGETFANKHRRQKQYLSWPADIHASATCFLSATVILLPSPVVPVTAIDNRRLKLVLDTISRVLNWLVDWLIDWLIGWMDGWMVGWLVGWLVGCLTARQHRTMARTSKFSTINKTTITFKTNIYWGKSALTHQYAIYLSIVGVACDLESMHVSCTSVQDSRL